MTPSHRTAAARALASRAPRYTSYPPANRFTEDVGPAQAEAWMRAVPNGASISLYVHIPFCRRLCWFCACRTQGSRTGAPLGPYLDALEREIELVARLLPPDLSLSHLHLGGGTPTFLDPAQTTRLFGMVDARFARAPDAEISVEIDPTEVDGARLAALAAAGVTRASLGVQDFDPAVQEAIGRLQSFDQTRDAVEGLRARGIASINLDLLCGLPHQSAASLGRTLDAALDLAPDRIALYGYAHVPRASARETMIREDALPSPEARLELAIGAARRIEASGYAPVGIDHYAKPADALARAARAGTLRRNFQGYATDISDVLIGLGASSISRFPQGYVQNAPRTADWKARLAFGRLPAMRGHALGAEDRPRGALIERLLCDFAVAPVAGPEGALARRFARAAARAWPGIARRTEGAACVWIARRVTSPGWSRWSSTKAHPNRIAIAQPCDEGRGRDGWSDRGHLMGGG